MVSLGLVWGTETQGYLVYWGVVCNLGELLQAAPRQIPFASATAIFRQRGPLMLLSEIFIYYIPGSILRQEVEKRMEHIHIPQFRRALTLAEEASERVKVVVGEWW